MLPVREISHEVLWTLCGQVVAVGGLDEAEYRWVIEFQCTEREGSITFFGINFYSRTNSTDVLPEVTRISHRSSGGPRRSSAFTPPPL
jgi:hypothetical protein